MNKLIYGYVQKY